MTVGRSVSPGSPKEVVTCSNGGQGKLPEIPYPMFCVPDFHICLESGGTMPLPCPRWYTHTPLTYREWNKCFSPNEVPTGIQEVGRVELIWGFPV